MGSFGENSIGFYDIIISSKFIKWYFIKIHPWAYRLLLTLYIFARIPDFKSIGTI
jgi:hypothetical protein